MMTKLLIITSIFLLNLCDLIALDIKKDIEGVNCSVTEPLGNYTFNFTEIISEFGYHKNGDVENMGQYSFNICKSLSRKCRNETAAACLKKHRSSEEVIIGYDSKLYWNNGQIRLSYVGEKCKGETNYTLNVQLHCDYTDTKNDFLGVFHLDDQCEINIIFRTPKACLPIPENVKNAKLFIKTASNKTLNLSPLKSSNHFADAPAGNSFILGYPILYGHDAMCPAGTSVCFVNNTEKDINKKFKNMGMLTSDIKFEFDSPVLFLTSDEVCKGKQKYSSKIVFECDELVEEGTPKFIKEDDCVNYFIQETRHACVEEKSCQISGPNGELYDFSSLAGTQYQIKRANKTNEFIHFSLCSAANECGESVWGSCIVKTGDNGNRQTTNAGLFSKQLQVHEKNAFLKYDSGAVCNWDEDNYSTRIEFILADNLDDEEVVLIEDKCEIVIHFKTLLVNQNGRNCMVKNRNDVEIDLRPLIDYNGNYEAKIATNESSDVHYFLNICRPLNSKYSLDCHGNSAACRTVIKENKHEEELSLGHFDYIMTTEPGKVPDTTNVIMKYFHGSKCPEDQNDHISTKITFFCDESAGYGTPMIKSTEDCQYSFDFGTNILCNSRHLQLKNNDSCELINDQINTTLNLKLFGVFKGEKAKVDICDNLSKAYTLNYKNSMVVIEYGQYDRDIEVQLKCGLANNTKIEVNKYQIRVMDESTTVCPFMNIVPKMMDFVAAPKPNDSTSNSEEQQKHNENETSSSGFSLGYIFLIGILLVAFAAFFIVLRNPERREILMNIVKFKSRSNIRYARVNASEESALLMNHDLIPSDSDDENILL